MAETAMPPGVAPGELAAEVARRFRPSQIEMGRRDRAGTVTRRGSLVTLVAPMPARPFRVAGTAGSRGALQHVMDFARVDVATDGGIQTETSWLTVPAGTELVILDVTLDESAVHLFAHTAVPLPVRLGGESVYGCTEFVFHFDPKTRAPADPLFARIGQWLSDPAGERVCANGVEPLCIEP